MADWWPFGKKSVKAIESRSASVAAALLTAKHEAQRTGKNEILLEAAYNAQLAAIDKLREAVLQQKSAAAALKKKTKELANHEKAFDDFLMNDMDPRARGSAYRNLLMGLKMVALQRAKQDLKMG
ncbi:MAG: hypothetical protein QW666_01125 [Candidatus Woesearchaeota archaeon]